MVVLCCYGQGVEEDEEHHYPVKALGFHIQQALHPEETVPATGQAAKHKNKPGLVCRVTVIITCKNVYIYIAADSLVVDNSTLSFQVIQAVCIRVTD